MLLKLDTVFRQPGIGFLKDLPCLIDKVLLLRTVYLPPRKNEFRLLRRRYLKDVAERLGIDGSAVVHTYRIKHCLEVMVAVRTPPYYIQAKIQLGVYKSYHDYI